MEKLVPSGEYDRLDHEPEVAIVIASQRIAEDRSYWGWSYWLEGENNAPLSKTQAQWTAGMLRHAARMVEGEAISTDGGQLQRIASYARYCEEEARIAAMEFVMLLHVLAVKRGLHRAASMLAIKETRARHLLKAHEGFLHSQVAGDRWRELVARSYAARDDLELENWPTREREKVTVSRGAPQDALETPARKLAQR